MLLAYGKSSLYLTNFGFNNFVSANAAEVFRKEVLPNYFWLIRSDRLAFQVNRRVRLISLHINVDSPIMTFLLFSILQCQSFRVFQSNINKVLIMLAPSKLLWLIGKMTNYTFSSQFLFLFPAFLWWKTCRNCANAYVSRCKISNCDIFGSRCILVLAVMTYLRFMCYFADVINNSLEGQLTALVSKPENCLT